MTAGRNDEHARPLDHLAPREPTTVICIEPLGTNVILPALLVGYEVPDAEAADKRLDATLPPDGPIVAVAQQAGGYCMRYPTAVGTLLRLESNDGNGVRPFAELVRGLKAMGEDPDQAVLADYPTLRGLWGTWGDPYAPTELDRLGRYVRRFFDVPPLAWGVEAYVRFEPCDPLAYFGGWKVLSCRPASPDRQRWRYAGRVGFHVDDSNVTELARDDDQTLDEELLRRIMDVGCRLGLVEPPNVFLLWENSD